MGIESLNSAAAAAGFAMVSDEGAEETDSGYAIATHTMEPESRSPSSNLPAIVDGGARGPASPATLGARVTGMLDSWLSKA